VRREPDEEGRTGETEQLPFSDKLTDAEWCQHYLEQISPHSSLVAIAAKVLEELATIADVCTQVVVAPIPEVKIVTPTPVSFELVELPETHARQGSADCPGGMCSIDH
jgi:hypothetical protein